MDIYKVKILMEMLKKQKEEENYLCRLKGDDTASINLDEEALTLLLQYYSKDESYTAFCYGQGGLVHTDLSTYDNKEEAIAFAKHRNWDEVVNDLTGEIVWSRN